MLDFQCLPIIFVPRTILEALTCDKSCVFVLKHCRLNGWTTLLHWAPEEGLPLYDQRMLFLLCAGKAFNGAELPGAPCLELFLLKVCPVFPF